MGCKLTRVEERDDLGNKEGSNPGCEQNGSPRNPANHGVVRHVSCSLEKAEEDESTSDTGIQASKEENRGDHEREGYLLVKVFEGAERRSCHVLVANSGIHDASDNAEDDNLGNRASPQRLGEITIHSTVSKIQELAV